MKWQRAYQILVVLMLILPLKIFSQQQMPLFAQKLPHILNSSANFQGKENQDVSDTSRSFIVEVNSRSFSVNPFPIRLEPVGANFTIQHLPFFCKKEFLFEKNTSIPLRLRLGSLDYVNKLEGKENH